MTSKVVRLLDQDGGILVRGEHTGIRGGKLTNVRAWLN